MSYKKAMKHWRNVKRHKLTASRLRGNVLVFGGKTQDAEKLAAQLKGK